MNYRPTHYMQLPREILIGRGVLAQLTEACWRLGFRSSIFALVGPKVYDIVGRDVIGDLERSGYKVEYSFVEESDKESLEKACEQIEKDRHDVVLGIGGGTVVDIAKLSSTKSTKHFISIPTAASHDGISSPRASIKGLDKPTSIQAQAPIAILADIDVISQSPYRLTASGCGDIIAKYTAVEDWNLGHRLKQEYYGEYASNLALMSSKLVMKNTESISNGNEEGLRILLEALISCGVAMSIAGSSRPCSGSEHLFSHAMDLVSDKPALHGEQCGVGAIMMAYLQGRDWKMVRDRLEGLRAPTTAQELDVEAEHVIEALTKAHLIRPERYTILGNCGLKREEAEEVASITGVIH